MGSSQYYAQTGYNQTETFLKRQDKFTKPQAIVEILKNCVDTVYVNASNTHIIWCTISGVN